MSSLTPSSANTPVPQRLMMSPVLGVSFLALVLSGGAWAFAPIGGGASTHVSITGVAVLQKVTDVCRAIAETEGRDFTPTGNSAEELVKACLGPKATGEVSAAKFKSALNEIYVQNGQVDRDFVNSPAHHFNSEAFAEGRHIITDGKGRCVHSVRQQRVFLGKLQHSAVFQGVGVGQDGVTLATVPVLTHQLSLQETGPALLQGLRAPHISLADGERGMGERGMRRMAREREHDTKHT
ncbi:unnamed protein product [Coregonus sp. 'balchen']|nr:unnamed protein product [Coregonus sp. 'balchen']